jgi:hypothetical protein
MQRLPIFDRGVPDAPVIAKGSVMMKRLMMILVTALLAGSLLTATAEARGGGGGGGGFGGGGGHMGGGGFGGHMGGLGDGAGGGHIGGLGADHIGGFGGDRMEGFGDNHLGLGEDRGSHGFGVARHARHLGGGWLPYDDDLYNDYGLDCYDFYNHRPIHRWQSSCS